MSGVGRPPLWSDADDARLRILWDEGLSTAEIGRLIGRTKGAVCGRAGRINCPPRVNPLTNTQALVRKVTVKKSRVELVLKMPAAQPSFRFAPVGKHNCKFPMWGMGRATHVYCDAPATKTYCKPHARLCYVSRGLPAQVAA